MRKKVFYPCHTVTSVQLLPNGEIMTTATKKEVRIVVADGTGGGGTGSFQVLSKGETQVQFRSKAVVINHGGRQELHPDFFQWFPVMIQRRDRLFLSDEFL